MRPEDTWFFIFLSALVASVLWPIKSNFRIRFLRELDRLPAGFSYIWEARWFDFFLGIVRIRIVVDQLGAQPLARIPIFLKLTQEVSLQQSHRLLIWSPNPSKFVSDSDPALNELPEYRELFQLVTMPPRLNVSWVQLHTMPAWPAAELAARLNAHCALIQAAFAARPGELKAIEFASLPIKNKTTLSENWVRREKFFIAIQYGLTAFVAISLCVALALRV